MILEIIRISAAIILGFIALGIIIFIFTFAWWTIIGVTEGVKEALRDLPKIIEEKKPRNLEENSTIKTIMSKTKYKIVYDESSCYNWGFSINDVWRSGEVEAGVKQPEEDDELIDYLLLKLK
jgi:hypothetical protein